MDWVAAAWYVVWVGAAFPRARLQLACAASAGSPHHRRSQHSAPVRDAAPAARHGGQLPALVCVLLKTSKAVLGCARVSAAARRRALLPRTRAASPRCFPSAPGRGPLPRPPPGSTAALPPPSDPAAPPPPFEASACEPAPPSRWPPLGPNTHANLQRITHGIAQIGVACPGRGATRGRSRVSLGLNRSACRCGSTGED